MIDLIFEILYNLFGWRTDRGMSRKSSVWSRLLLVLIILLSILGLFVMIWFVISKAGRG